MIGLTILIVVLVLLVIIGIVGYIVGIYNGLVHLRENIKKSWANIDVLLKQRSDELPKLVASVKGYMKHEKELLVQLTEARTAIMGAKTTAQKAKADGEISAALKSIFAVAENYPQLKANESFLQLQNRISELENSLADRREFYNDSANTFNIRIKSFPDMIVAGRMRLQEAEMFKVGEAEKQDVKIEF
jgi:LemA protein